MKPGDVKRLVRRVFTQEKVDYELAVVFVDDVTMSRLNKKYRDRNGSTDVLAFSMQEGEDARFATNTLGDVIVCVDRAREQADELGHPLKKELLILVLHGLLHLLGYDHEEMLDRVSGMEEELGV